MKYFSALSGLYLLFFIPAVAALDQSPVDAALEEEAVDAEPAAPARYPLNSIVAVVNEDIILATELERASRQITRQLEEKGTPIPDQTTLNKEVLNKLPMEFAVEAQKLLEISLEGSVG